MGLTKLDPNVIGQDSTGTGKITSAGGSVSIDSSGNVRIANSSANSVLFAAGGTASIGTTTTDGDFNVASTSTYQGIFQRTTSGGSAGNFALRNSRGTVASPSASANGDNLFQFHFQGYDGTNWRNGAAINAVLNGTISTTSMPADLILKTVPDGSLTETERVRITANGYVGIGNTSPIQKLHVEGQAHIANGVYTSGYSSGFSTWDTENNASRFYSGSSGSGTYLLMWPKSADGAYFSGIITLDNYDGPSAFELHIHNMWNNNGSIFGSGSTKYGSGLYVKRVTYNGVTWVALQHKGAINRGWRLMGIMNNCSIKIGGGTISDQATLLDI